MPNAKPYVARVLLLYLRTWDYSPSTSKSGQYQVAFSQPYVYDVLVEVCHASAVADPGEPDSRA